MTIKYKFISTLPWKVYAVFRDSPTETHRTEVIFWVFRTTIDEPRIADDETIYGAIVTADYIGYFRNTEEISNFERYEIE